MGADPGDVEGLYGLPREEFLPARDALAKQLKAAGNSEAAEEIKKLRKPTVAAWAVNRLARDRAQDVERLIEAGEELGRLQRRAASGVSRDELRAASAGRRKQIDSLVAAAEGVLREAGHPTTRQTLDQVAQTFEAMAIDEEARERVRRGIVDRELAPEAGFGDLGALSVVPAAAEGEKGPRRPAGRGTTPETDAAPARTAAAERARGRERERDARRRARVERLGAEADQAEADAREHREAAARAERAAMKARDAATRAEARAVAAAKRLEAAVAELPDSG